jgi:5-methyltetrahydrofolate--homocysteine methyltransferase
MLKQCIMKKIIQEVQQGRILVSDGAWGTYLHKKGLKPGECPELWNLQRPEDVLEIARSYVQAGADMIETNSFGASHFKLANYGLGDKVFEINRSAAEISRKAAGPDRFVLGSIGPTGKMLIMEEVTEVQLYECFKTQSMALEAGGADAIIIETMTDLEEARIAVRASVENTSCDVICTMTFQKTITGEYRTMMGISPTQMTEALVEEGVSVVGANCGNGMADMTGIVKEIRQANATIPIIVHANAGLPTYTDGITTFPESPADMAGRVKELISAGVNIIGGCCGTTPEHISRMHAVVHSL